MSVLCICSGQGGWQGVDSHMFTGSVEFIRVVENRSLAPSMTKLVVRLARLTRPQVSPVRGLMRVRGLVTMVTSGQDVDICRGRR